MAGRTSGDRLGSSQREQTARQRLLTADARLRAAEARDEIAAARDAAALARDQAADARDLAMTQLDAAAAHFDDARARAAEQRALAAQDRHDAAQDREAAAQERLRALVDREALAREVALAETDPLTGARSRAAGLTDLERELDRCRRTGGWLVVAYVDIVGLKAVNDSEGHAAGDELIKRAVRFIRAQLRSYDLVIRLGGDEFLCAMSNMTLPDARRRFAAIGREPYNCSIRTGFAELEPDDSVTDVIARADGELIDSLNREGAGAGPTRQRFRSSQFTRPPR